MMRGATILWAALATIAGTGLFMLKYEVQTQEHRLAGLRKDIVDTQQAIHVLKAEWSYLNDPLRLRDQAERHLGLHPMKPGQIVSLDSLPMADPRPAPVAEDMPGAAPVAAPVAAAPAIAQARPVAPASHKVATPPAPQQTAPQQTAARQQPHPAPQHPALAAPGGAQPVALARPAPASPKAAPPAVKAAAAKPAPLPAKPALTPVPVKASVPAPAGAPAAAGGWLKPLPAPAPAKSGKAQP